MIDTWSAAVARARKRWDAATSAERQVITLELDELWLTLHPSGSPLWDLYLNPDFSQTGPRHVSLRALLTCVPASLGAAPGPGPG